LGCITIACVAAALVNKHSHKRAAEHMWQTL